MKMKWNLANAIVSISAIVAGLLGLYTEAKAQQETESALLEEINRQVKETLENELQ